jgi:hypothetical protein
MCLVEEPVICNCVCNYEVCSRVDKERLNRPEDFFAGVNIKKRSNFYQLFVFGYTYTVFVDVNNDEKPAHIGVTGLPDENYINVCAYLLASSFGINVPRTKGVCNSTYHGEIYCATPKQNRLPISQLIKEYLDNPLADFGYLDFSFRPHYFPGVTIKTLTSGTITLFNNGKYHIVGVTCKEKAKLLHRKLCAIIRHCWRISPPETSCVWIAG